MNKLGKILYAEDEPDVQTIVQMVVEEMSDYEIKICGNGRLLLESVGEYNPDLILLDVMMPEMDGPETYKNLQRNQTTKNIPVIFMTAKAQVHEVQLFSESGVIGVITKPFDPIELCSEIQRIWDKKVTNG